MNPEIRVLYLPWLKPGSLCGVCEQFWKQAGYNVVKRSATQFCSALPILGQFLLPPPPLALETKCPLLSFHVTKQPTFRFLFIHSYVYAFSRGLRGSVEGPGGPRGSATPSFPGLGLPICSRRRWVRPVLFKLTEPQNPLFKGKISSKANVYMGYN